MSYNLTQKGKSLINLEGLLYFDEPTNKAFKMLKSLVNDWEDSMYYNLTDVTYLIRKGFLEEKAPKVLEEAEGILKGVNNENT